VMAGFWGWVMGGRTIVAWKSGRWRLVVGGQLMAGGLKSLVGLQTCRWSWAVAVGHLWPAVAGEEQTSEVAAGPAANRHQCSLFNYLAYGYYQAQSKRRSQTEKHPSNGLQNRRQSRLESV
jgi:hypothetical protein